MGHRHPRYPLVCFRYRYGPCPNGHARVSPFRFDVCGIRDPFSISDPRSCSRRPTRHLTLTRPSVLLARVAPFLVVSLFVALARCFRLLLSSLRSEWALSPARYGVVLFCFSFLLVIRFAQIVLEMPVDVMGPQPIVRGSRR